MADTCPDLILQAGFASADTGVTVYADATLDPAADRVHLVGDCRGRTETVHGHGQETWTLEELAQVPGRWCRCVNQPARYSDLLPATQVLTLMHLLPVALPESPMRAISTLRENAAWLTAHADPAASALAAREVADAHATVAALVGTRGYHADAGLALVREIGPVPDRDTPIDGRAAYTQPSLPAVHAARLDAALTAMLRTGVPVVDPIPGVTRTTAADLPAPVRARLGALWHTVAGHTMWFRVATRAVTATSPLLGWALAFDPAVPVLVRLPSVMWWTNPGQSLTPVLADGTIPAPAAAAAWRVADGDPTRVEDAHLALVAAHT